MNAQVYPIFPTPLYVANYDKDLKDVIDYFDSSEMQDTKAGYGMISTNSYILDNPICNELNTFLMSCFEDFATNIMRYRFKELGFAQSWLTYKNPNQIHKAHTHPNTILAGVFYYDAHEDDAAICFSKDVKSFNRSYFEPSLHDDYQNHVFSQEEIYYMPKKNDFLIFPSWLTHGVPPNSIRSKRLNERNIRR
jgi:uncharacterized protein (TIGR02466 family)